MNAKKLVMLIAAAVVAAGCGRSYRPPLPVIPTEVPTVTPIPTATPTPACSFSAEVFPARGTYTYVYGAPKGYTALRVVPNWAPACGEFKFRFDARAWVYASDDGWYELQDPEIAARDHVAEVRTKSGEEFRLAIAGWVGLATPTLVIALTPTPGW